MSEKQLEADFNSAQRMLANPQTVFSFYRLLASLIAKIKCGHTELLLPSELQSTLNNKEMLIPFGVIALSQHLYITEDLSGNGLKGHEILSINGIAAPTIISSFLKLIPADANIETGRTWTLNHRWYFNKYLRAFTDIRNPFEIVVSSKNGRKTIRLKGTFLPHKEETQFATLTFLNNVAVMVIPSFDESTLTAFYKNSFEQIRRKGTTRLILDLRNNPGGWDHLGAELVAYLLDHPFQYYKEFVRRSSTSVLRNI